jgi:hypothetical protein
MSVRAYRVNNIELKDNPSFNLSHDDKLMAFFEEMDISIEDDGIREISVAILEKALTQADELDLDDYLIETIADDIAWAKEKGEEYISYSCY